MLPARSKTVREGRSPRFALACLGCAERRRAVESAVAIARHAAAIWLFLAAGSALAGPPSLPTGGTVAAGRTTIAGSGDRGLVITQSSDRAVIGWRGFDVAAGHSVNFVQPGAGSAILNRVTGNTASTIAGSITANGQLFLVNPNGISITPSGTVRAAGFVASTLDIDDADFMAGRLSFRAAGAAARVANAGSIVASPGGFAALLGRSVSNAGTIEVPLGRVGLGAGERVVLDLQGNGFLQVAVPGVGAGGEPLVEQSGRISADGGRVQLSAGAALEAARQVVNLSGIVEARTVGGRTGEIVLEGGSGAVRVSGRLDASARADAGQAEAGGHGGRITVTGRQIDLAGALLDVSGTLGGGLARVGGDTMGAGPLQRAETLTVDAATRLRADATQSGDAGSIVLWSDSATRFDGTISARGFGAGASGGFAEVSSAGVLDYRGAADLRGDGANFGTLLLDPRNVTISTGTNTSGFSATVNNSVINVSTLQAALASASVVVDTGSGGTQSGDITVANAVTWSSGSTLTLSAARNVVVNAALSAAAGGGITLVAGNQVTLANALSVGAGAGSGVRLTANESIVGNAGSAITTQGQAILLNSDRDANGSGAISLSGHTMASNGGSITLGGGAGTIGAGSGYAFGTAASPPGVNLFGSRIAAGGGDLVINGRGLAATASGNSGVKLDSSSAVSTVGAGTVRLTGFGGGAGDSGANVGVALQAGSTATTEHGALSMIGTGGGAGAGSNNYGVLVTIAGSAIRSTGTGSITVTGQAGNAAGTTSTGNVGVYLSAAGAIAASGGGTIDITGTGGGAASSGASQQGIALVTGSTIVGSGGAMALTGTGGASAGSGNFGIQVSSGSVTNTRGGALSLNGVGAGRATGGHQGVRLTAGAIVSTEGGALTVVGRVDNAAALTQSGGNIGVLLRNASVLSSIDGTISITGTGGGAGSGSSNYGVQIANDGTAVRTTGTGAISITGTGGNANGSGASANSGVLLGGNARIATAGGGTLSIVGTAVGSATATGLHQGVQLYGGATIAGSGGAMTLTGTASAAGDAINYGIQANGVSVTNTGSGALTLIGAGSGGGTAGDHHGVRVGGGSVVSTATGTLSISGRVDTAAGATGSDRNVGVGIYSGVSSTDGAVSISGAVGGVAGGSDHAGVAISDGGSVTSATGAISIAGSSVGAGAGHHGVRIGSTGTAGALSTGGAGTLAVLGSASPGSEHYGIAVFGPATLATGAETGTTLTADTMHFVGTVSGSGILTLQPATASAAIGLGDGARGTLLLDAASIAALQPGFSGVTVGRADGSGAIDVRASAWANDLRLRGAASPVSIDGALSVGARHLSFDSGGDVTQSAPITAGAIELRGAGVGYRLMHPDNAVGTVAGEARSVELASSTPLAVGTVNASSGLRAAGPILLQSIGAASDLTLEQPVVSGAGGDAVVLAAGRNFVDLAGSAAIGVGPGGRFLVYSTDWSADTPGGLVAGRLYGREFAAAGPASIVQPGSRFVFRRRPVLTVTVDDATRVYGDSNPAFGYAVSGLLAGDTAQGALDATPVPASTAGARSNVGRYAITTGPLASAQGYAVDVVPGELLVTRRPLDLVADSARRAIGEPNPAFAYSVASGLLDGDTVSGALATDATAASPIGRYAISRGSLAASDNYTLGVVAGTLFVLPADTPAASTFIPVYQTATPRVAASPSSVTVGTDTVVRETAPDAARGPGAPTTSAPPAEPGRSGSEPDLAPAR